jgi:hypothetical protein
MTRWKRIFTRPVYWFEVEIGEKRPGPFYQLLKDIVQQIRGGGAGQIVQCILFHIPVVADKAGDKEAGGYACVHVVVCFGDEQGYRCLGGCPGRLQAFQDMFIKMLKTGLCPGITAPAGYIKYACQEKPSERWMELHIGKIGRQDDILPLIVSNDTISGKIWLDILPPLVINAEFSYSRRCGELVD